MHQDGPSVSPRHAGGPSPTSGRPHPDVAHDQQQEPDRRLPPKHQQDQPTMTPSSSASTGVNSPGPKHQRRIVLENWQREIVERCPGDFARGLFHSDGCRTINWTTRIIAGRLSGTNTLATSSPMSPLTSSRSVVGRSISSEFNGDWQGPTPSRWPAPPAWPSSTSTWDRRSDPGPVLATIARQM
jgi:hypothetical protein